MVTRGIVQILFTTFSLPIHYCFQPTFTLHTQYRNSALYTIHTLSLEYTSVVYTIYTVQICAIHYKDSRWEWARWISTKALHQRECAGYTLYSVPGVVYTQFVFLWAGSMRIVWRGSQCWLESR